MANGEYNPLNGEAFKLLLRTVSTWAINNWGCERMNLKLALPGSRWHSDNPSIELPLLNESTKFW